MLGASARRAGGLLLVLIGRTEAIYATDGQEASPTFCTVYTHMVKAGGSSIKQQLMVASRKSGGRKPLFCNQGGATDEACLEATSNATVITGGNVEKLRYGLDEMGRECEFFTMLRHPIDRAVSAFFYCPQDHDIQNRPPEWCGYSNHPTPAKERLVGFLRSTWGNIAFRQLSIGLHCHPGIPCAPNQKKRPMRKRDDNLLRNVKGIMGTYTAIGIMEHWDLSMQLFDAKVKSPVRSWQEHRHANPGLGSPLRDEVYRWAHGNPEIHKIMETDMLVYSYALSLFKVQTNETLGTAWP